MRVIENHRLVDRAIEACAKRVAADHKVLRAERLKVAGKAALARDQRAINVGRKFLTVVGHHHLMPAGVGDREAGRVQGDSLPAVRVQDEPG